MTPSRIPVALAASFALLSAGCVHDPTPEEWKDRGRAEARADIRAGRLGQRYYGMPVPGGGPGAAYRVAIRDEFGIESECVGGCTALPGVFERANGYNEVMKAEIENRFGPGVLDAVWERVNSRGRAPDRPAP